MRLNGEKKQMINVFYIFDGEQMDWLFLLTDSVLLVAFHIKILLVDNLGEETNKIASCEGEQLTNEE